MKRQIDQKVAEGRYQFEARSCAVCGGSVFELLSDKDRYGLFVPVAVCPNCGLIQANPSMNRESYEEFYNSEYRKLYVGEEKPTDAYFQGRYKKGRQIYEFLLSNQLVPVGQSPFILEVGCAAGGILRFFKDLGWRVRGIDLGREYIENGRARYGLDLSVDTLESVILDRAPDLIIYSHVLEHILNPNAELQMVRRLLSDAGLLYVEVPGVKHLMNYKEMDFLRLVQNAHVYYFTLRTLTNLLSKNSFRLLVGSERITSVFCKDNIRSTPWEFVNDHGDVLAYLRRTELLRKVLPIPPYKVKSKLFGFLKSLAQPFSRRGTPRTPQGCRPEDTK